MITINFNNHRIICINHTYIKQLINLFKDTHQASKAMDLLDQYSFENWDYLKTFVNQDIKIKVHEKNSYLMYSRSQFEYLLKLLEPIFLYQRDFELLQVNVLPNLYIYTYSGIWEEDFDKFQEAPNGTYDWDNLPKELKSPNSNMQVQSYDPNAHIAIIYHYYTL